MRRYRWVWLVLGVVLVGLGVATGWRGQSARLFGTSDLGQPSPSRDDGAPKASGTARSSLGDYGQVPDFELVNQSGETVRLQDLLGSLWIGDFIFTSCASSCPMMTARLEELSRSVDPQLGVRFVSFSVDPDRDTPERLSEYAASYGAENHSWWFLTGEKQSLRKLVVDGFRLGLAEATPEEIEQGAEAVLHSTRFVLVDRGGTIRGYYDALDAAAMSQLQKDLAYVAREDEAGP